MGKESQISSRFLVADDYPRWEQLVSVSAHGSIYSLPSYLEVLCRAVGGTFRILGVFRNEQLCGGCALFETTRYGAPVVQNRLLLYYNGLVLQPHQTRYPSEKTSRDLDVLTALESALGKLSYGRLLLHNRAALSDVRPFLNGKWSVRPSYTYSVSLADLPAQWLLVEKNLRRLIERCTEQGVTCTDDDDFESFFALHWQTHIRKHAPLYLAKDSFAEYFRTLHQKNLCRLFQARMSDGRVIASQLVLLGHPVTHTVSAGADSEFLKMGATPFLRWRAFEALAAQGFIANDLTDAALNSITHFKSQLGGELQSTWVISRPDSWRLRLCDTAAQPKRLLGAALNRLQLRGHSAENGQ